MLDWWFYLLAALAPVFLVNSIPHFVAGVSGRRFPTPFVGGPPRLDSPSRNVLWGGMNLILGGALFWPLRNSLDNLIIVAELVIFGWLFAWFLSRIFSRLP